MKETGNLVGLLRSFAEKVGHEHEFAGFLKDGNGFIDENGHGEFWEVFSDDVLEEFPDHGHLNLYSCGSNYREARFLNISDHWLRKPMLMKWYRCLYERTRCWRHMVFFYRWTIFFLIDRFKKILVDIFVWSHQGRAISMWADAWIIWKELEVCVDQFFKILDYLWQNLLSIFAILTLQIELNFLEIGRYILLNVHLIMYCWWSSNILLHCCIHTQILCKLINSCRPFNPFVFIHTPKPVLLFVFD